MNFKKHRKKILQYGILFLALLLVSSLMILGVSAAVCDKTKNRIVTTDALLNMQADFDYILVLGCLVREDGTLSDRLFDRVSVGISLYQMGISDRILMSGDSYEREEYDEVGAMKREAIDKGVPEDAVLVDPHGLSTYESLYRLREMFAGKRVVIVTQRYHLFRALYIAEKLGIEAYGVDAALRPYQKQIAMETREVLARCKDVCYSLLQPKPTVD